MSEIAPAVSTPTSGSSSTPSAAPSTSAPTKTPTAPSSPSKPSNPTPKPGTAPVTSAAPKPTSEPSEPQVYQFKVKIDGKEKVIKGTEAEITTYLQKAEASDARFREAAALKKKFQEAIAYGQQDPDRAIAAFKELFGHDFDELAEKRLASKYEESTLSEEEKTRRKELEDARKDREKLKQYETQAQQKARKEQEDKLWAEMEQTYFGALEKIGYEKDPAILNLIADIDDSAAANGYELSDAQLVSEANRRLEGNAKHVMKRLTKPGAGPDLLNFLGPDGVKAVITAEMERRRMTVPGSEQPQIQTQTPNNRSQPENKPSDREELIKRRKATKNSFFRMQMGLDE